MVIEVVVEADKVTDSILDGTVPALIVKLLLSTLSPIEFTALTVT